MSLHSNLTGHNSASDQKSTVRIPASHFIESTATNTDSPSERAFLVGSQIGHASSHEAVAQALILTRWIVAEDIRDGLIGCPDAR